jgi:DNA-binding LacI/PurR family transcriptional regulator
MSTEQALHRNLETGSAKGRPAVLYKKVYDQLCEWILSGRCGPGDLLPSERELCHILNVSRITIRRAISELESNGWIRNISRKGNVICEHAGTVIPPVSMLVFQKTYDDCMRHGQVSFLDRLSGAITECRKQNIPFNIATIQSSIDLDELRSKRQSLLIFEWKLFEQLKNFLIRYPDYPAVTCLLSLADNWLSSPPPVSSVINDDAPGVREATEWLISLGKRNIIYLGKDNYNFNLKSRQNAYMSVMTKHNLKPNLIIANAEINLPVYKGQAVKQVSNARATMRNFLTQGGKADAVIGSNDAYAYGAYDALREFGIKVHDECTVVGFDDSIIAGLSDPPLYSVYKPRFEAGSEAIRLLLNSFKKKSNTHEKIVLNSRFIVD